MELTANQALSLMHRVLVGALKADKPDLSTRQFGILLQIYLAPPPHTVRGLARGLGISKPAVTRALDRLAAHDLVRRKVDEHDRRSVLVQRTVQGAVLLREFGDIAIAEDPNPPPRTTTESVLRPGSSDALPQGEVEGT